jgi:hypothetical protein
MVLKSDLCSNMVLNYNMLPLKPKVVLNNCVLPIILFANNVPVVNSYIEFNVYWVSS